MAVLLDELNSRRTTSGCKKLIPRQCNPSCVNFTVNFRILWKHLRPKVKSSPFQLCRIFRNLAVAAIVWNVWKERNWYQLIMVRVHTQRIPGRSKMSTSNYQPMHHSWRSPNQCHYPSRNWHMHLILYFVLIRNCWIIFWNNCRVMLLPC